MRKLFGTDGVRGVANMEPMTVETALKLGRAAAYVFRRDERRHRIVIGKDTRLSGYMLESALVAGICSMGMDTLLVGPLPTPGIAFITRSLRADAGIVISASHNPYEDNGIKFFSNDGFKLPDRIEEDIEALISSGEIDSIRPTATEVGKAYRIDDARGRYVEFLKNSFPKGVTLEGLRVVLDCANGAAYKVAPRALKELGAEVVLLNDQPDGENINKNCGSLYPEKACKRVVDFGADIGIALDGDADRAIFIDERGRIVDGDHIMAICAIDLLEVGGLKNDTLVTTVMSNMGLEKAIRSAGGKLVRTAVGDRYVVEEMLKGGYNFGGEQSGHLVFLDHTSTGDGTMTALQITAIMEKTGKSLSDLAGCMQRMPQVLLNIKISKKKPLKKMSNVQKTIKDIEKKMNGNGRVLVRFSGTRPLVRVMVEGEDTDRIKIYADEIADSLRAELVK
jgi:phosphoglucosamine mutase